MNIFIYADESGVFDVVHNDYYVFAWVLCLGKESKDNISRKFINAEKNLRCCNKYNGCRELKAVKLKPKDKMSLYRSLNSVYRGSVIIKQQHVNENIFATKKTKQRFLDYALKRGIKSHLLALVENGLLAGSDIDNIYFALDEHTTATDGIYELREALIEELKYGTFNYTYQKFFSPPFPDIKNIDLKYCDSTRKTLIRAADIVANVTLHNAKNDSLDKLEDRQFIMRLP